jgi:hypothetical protein
MARKSISDAVTKWQQRVAQSGEYYRRGVQSTTKDWASNAVAAADRRNAGLQRAMSEGTIDAGIQRAGTNKWRNATLSKGVNAWTTNTPQAADRFQAGLQKSYNYMAAADQAIANMPGDTPQQRIARAGAWLTTMHEQADAAKRQP